MRSHEATTGGNQWINGHCDSIVNSAPILLLVDGPGSIQRACTFCGANPLGSFSPRCLHMLNFS